MSTTKLPRFKDLLEDAAELARLLNYEEYETAVERAVSTVFFQICHSNTQQNAKNMLTFLGQNYEHMNPKLGQLDADIAVYATNIIRANLLSSVFTVHSYREHCLIRTTVRPAENVIVKTFAAYSNHWEKRKEKTDA